MAEGINTVEKPGDKEVRLSVHQTGLTGILETDPDSDSVFFKGTNAEAGKDAGMILTGNDIRDQVGKMSLRQQIDIVNQLNNESVTSEISNNKNAMDDIKVISEEVQGRIKGQTFGDVGITNAKRYKNKAIEETSIVDGRLAMKHGEDYYTMNGTKGVIKKDSSVAEKFAIVPLGAIKNISSSPQQELPFINGLEKVEHMSAIEDIVPLKKEVESVAPEVMLEPTNEEYTAKENPLNPKISSAAEQNYSAKNKPPDIIGAKRQNYDVKNNPANGLWGTLRGPAYDTTRTMPDPEIKLSDVRGQKHIVSENPLDPQIKTDHVRQKYGAKPDQRNGAWAKLSVPPKKETPDIGIKPIESQEQKYTVENNSNARKQNLPNAYTSNNKKDGKWGTFGKKKPPVEPLVKPVEEQRNYTVKNNPLDARVKPLKQEHVYTAKDNPVNARVKPIEKQKHEYTVEDKLVKIVGNKEQKYTAKEDPLDPKIKTTKSQEQKYTASQKAGPEIITPKKLEVNSTGKTLDKIGDESLTVIKNAFNLEDSDLKSDLDVSNPHALENINKLSNSLKSLSKKHKPNYVEEKIRSVKNTEKVAKNFDTNDLGIVSKSKTKVGDVDLDDYIHRLDDISENLETTKKAIVKENYFTINENKADISVISKKDLADTHFDSLKSIQDAIGIQDFSKHMEEDKIGGNGFYNEFEHNGKKVGFRTDASGGKIKSSFGTYVTEKDGSQAWKEMDRKGLTKVITNASDAEKVVSTAEKEMKDFDAKKVVNNAFEAMSKSDASAVKKVKEIKNFNASKAAKDVRINTKGAGYGNDLFGKAGLRSMGAMGVVAAGAMMIKSVADNSLEQRRAKELELLTLRSNYSSSKGVY